jgi:hypothetical protein
VVDSNASIEVGVVVEYFVEGLSSLKKFLIKYLIVFN